MDIRRKLQNFLRTTLLDGDSFARLELRHLTDKGGSSIWDYKRGSRTIGDEDTLDEVDVDTLATEIETIASDDALGIGGMQRYVLLAFPDKGKTATRRCTFRIYGDDEADDEGAATPTEDATPKGIVSQAMRHQEVNFKTSSLFQAQAMQYQQRIIERQANHIEKLEEGRLKLYELQESLLSQHYDRELAKQKAERQEEMMREGFEMAKALLPHVANKAFGRPILPESSDPVFESLAKLFGSFNEEEQRHFNQFMMGLRSHNKVAVMTLLDSLDRKASESDDGEKPPNGKH